MIIQCPECGGKVSSEAIACPHCGYPIHKSTAKQTPNVSREDAVVSPVQDGTKLSYQATKSSKGWSGIIVILVVVSLLAFAVHSIIKAGQSSKGSGDDTVLTDSFSPMPNQSSSPVTSSPNVTTALPELNAQYEIVYSNVDVYTNSIGSTYAQVLVQVKNTGNCALFFQTSSVDLEDTSGKLISSLKYCHVYPTVLLPDETALLFENHRLDDNPGNEEFSVVPHLDVEAAKVDCIRYKITDDEITTDRYGNPKIIGRVENNTNESESFIYVVANLYNSDGLAVGQLYTILTDKLDPGEKTGFELTELSTSDDFSIDCIDYYEIVSFCLQYQF